MPITNTILTECISFLQNYAFSILKLKQIHAFSIRHGISPTNQDMGKHLIFTIVSLSSPMPYAHHIFSQIQNPNIFTYNTMIRGYAESNNPRLAVQLFNQMHLSSIEPDTHTFPFLLKAVSKLMSVRIGEEVHSISVRSGFETLVFVQNSLVYMYASCGQAESAHKMFDAMFERDIVAWNSVINGFALNGMPNEALTLFKEMSTEGVEPDGFTMVSLLSACAELGALALGRRVHVFLSKIGLNSNVHVNNSLLDLYAKCGSITEAEKVFNEMGQKKNVVSWTSLIVGFAINGFGEKAIELFKVMEREEGIKPSEITFVGVLYACSHCGLVDQGLDYFRRMKEEYGIKPGIEHHGCVVDLYGRAGLVKEAYKYIQNMRVPPNSVIWRTLLGACTIHGKLELGEIARANVLQLEPGHSGDYVLLSNLYASEGRWEDVQRIRRRMISEGVRKNPGYSFVELGNLVFEFMMGDRSVSESKELNEMLRKITNLLRIEGYVPYIGNVRADIEEEEKEIALSYHSEKIAVAFMLINTKPGSVVRVFKNLRVCVDCHVAIKLISKVFEREIVVRDRSRFHYFREGDCSCKDYW